ncbi:MAG: hypothetical protein ACRD0G_13770 [Acidimicrobiales bacterium]
MDVGQRRQPAGTPVGGQFAGRVGERSPVELSDTVVSHVLDAMDVAVRRSVRRYRDVDAEELRSTTVLDFVALARRDSTRVQEWNREPSEAERYATVMVRNLAWRMANPLDNSKQRTARKRLGEALAEYRALNRGRNPSMAEAAELAERVRMSIAPGMRPGRDYWQWMAGDENSRRVTLAADTDTVVDGDATRRNVHVPAVDDEGRVDDRVVAAVDDVLAARDRAVAAIGRRRANGVVARATYRGVEAMVHARGERLPTLVAVGHKRAEAASKLVRDGGGVDALCARWESGAASDAQEAALFAPWGRPGFTDQEAVVAMLRQLGPARADTAWRSALANARPHPEDTTW